MKLMPMEKLGTHEVSPGIVDFGLYLPWVSAAMGNRLWVKIIHEKDQFLQNIPPLEFELQHAVDAAYGDYWSTRVTVDPADRPHPDSAWGTPGRYVYRYCLANPNVPDRIDWIIDPFAREFGVGKLSAFELGYSPYTWSSEEANWRTPGLSDLVIYELMITEFGGDIDRTIAHLEYLADLGINCIELMPVSNVANVVDWGFLPIGHFGVDERFGNRKDLQKLIDAAHCKGIAVILDVVYGHTAADFPYAYLYHKLDYHQNPVMGKFAEDYFGESTDFRREFTRDFFFTVNHHWLDVYHTDGFRYDCVPNYWDGPTGDGYANLVYHTYRTVKQKQTAGGYWKRFFRNGANNLIQCAEQLEGPVDILNKTYSNCTWQNETLGAAQGTARNEHGQLENLAFRLGLGGYPGVVDHHGDTIAKSALHYIENHDHSRFVCNFGTIARDNELLQEGDRGKWFKVQPYLIGVFTARGIPLIWQGQEFGEDYFVPESGWGRVLLFRPVRWDYFYDGIGRRMISLVRTLLRLRRTLPQLRGGDHYFYNHYDRYLSRRVMLFSRRDGTKFSLIALNFSDSDHIVPFEFPSPGDYREELHGHDNLLQVAAGETLSLTIPSNYGCIWTLQTA